MGTIQQDEDEFKELLEGTTENQVVLGGEVVEGDYFQFIQMGVALLSVTGLGVHKTYTEYFDMLDQEDPMLIQAMALAVGLQQRRMFGDAEDQRETPEGQETAKTGKGKHFGVKESKKTKDYVQNVDDSSIAEMMFQFGKSPEEIRELKEKIQSGEIQVPKKDFSWLTPETLKSMSSEEFRQVRQEMMEYAEASPTVNLSMDKFDPMLPPEDLHK